MMDPLRLLESAHGGLERELLRSALAEVAPDAVRARVLTSVSEVLADTASVTSSGGAAAPSGLSKLALALKSVNGIYLAGVVVITAGVGGTAHYLTRGRHVAAPPQSQSVRLETSRLETSRLESGANVATMPAEEPFAEALVAPPTLPAPRAEASSLLPSTTRVRTPVAASRAARAVTPNTATGASDGLDTQMTLLAEARQYLKSGKLDDAARQLDRYDQRFPNGALEPEVAVLRERMREQRAARIPLPRTSQP